MSVNEAIEGALRETVPDIWPLACQQEHTPGEYIVYNPELEEAALFADNQDREWVQHMQVHYFTKWNYTKKRLDIRKALRGAGFLVTDIITMHEKDSGYHHLCFECSIEENMEE